MRYSAKERLIAKLLTSFPKLKLLVKYIYQRINFLIHKKKYVFKTDLKIEKISTPNSKHTFFGYYDRSPMSNDGKKVIFHSTSFNTHQEPNKCQEIDIMLYDIDSSKTSKISTTNAFNWQQGAKLQWLNNDEFIFNDYIKEKNQYVSKIYSLSGKKFRQIDTPIYDVHDNYALSLNFDRLTQLRPDYGYFSKTDLGQKFDYSNEGIVYVDLIQNSFYLLLSIDEIIQSHYHQSMDEADHLVNHIMISPNGNNFMFLHRWFNNGVRKDALMICDKNGKNLKCLADNDMVSHCFWKNSNEIIGYMRGVSKEDRYYSIDISNNKIHILDKLNGYGDGHPHINEHLLITDTYPNKSRMKELLLYDFNSNELRSIGEFYEPFDYYGQTRCDLHPRISFDKKYFFIDSVHDGERHLYMIHND
ncbi:MAG: hypothetical protein ACPHVP_04990 [Flavobacteriales bacterium]